MNFLIVVDMQNDFISGSLGSVHAAAIVPNVVKKVSSFDGTVIYTRDTHGADYMHTQEGEKLPIHDRKSCLPGSTSNGGQQLLCRCYYGEPPNSSGCHEGRTN